jgi:hypothetical protein
MIQKKKLTIWKFMALSEFQNCTCMHIKKNIDVFLLSQSRRHGVLEIDLFS